METKICTKCGQEKPLTEFNFKNKSKGVYQSQCRSCKNEQARQLYQTKYKERYLPRLKENKKKHRKQIHNLLEQIKSKGCCICGETDTCCLDFHHLYDKDFQISYGQDVSFERLFTELEKCILVCSNCHRKIHAGKLTLPLLGSNPSGETNTAEVLRKLKILYI